MRDTEEELRTGRADLRAPSDLLERGRELLGIVEDLHDRVLPSVRESAPVGEVWPVEDLLTWIRTSVLGARDVVAEERSTIGSEPGREPAPELFESLGRNVGDEEREHDEIEPHIFGRCPAEEVAVHILDARVSHAFTVDREHGFGRIDSDEARGARREAPREQSGTACEFEHDSGGVDVVESGFEPGSLLEPSRVALGAEIVGAAPEPDVVVLGSPVFVVPALVCQDLLDLSLHRFARFYAVGPRGYRDGVRDAPLLRGSLPVRLIALFVGLLLFAVAIVSMLESGLGLPPWDVLHMGIAEHSPLTLGVAGVVVGLVIVAVAWIGGAPPGFGTIANAVVIGLAIDAISSVDAVARLSEGPVSLRALLVVLGVWLFGVGSALYIGAGMGAGPRDSLMLALVRRTGWRIGAVRASIEVTVLLIGLALGGIAGIGTLTLALLVGPSVELSFWLLLRLGLADPLARAPEFGPLDAA
jgi:uncharacterized protein